MKKLLAILLALILVLGMVAYGATTETKTETTETKTETTETKTEEKKEEEKKEETKEEAVEETTEEEWPMLQASALCFTSTGFTPRAESAGVDYYREKYGLDLEVLPVDISQNEAWNIFWAGDGYADIILPYGNQGTTLVNEELVRPFEFDWLKEYMPRMYTLLQMIYGTDEAILAALKINGEVYCIPYFGGLSSNVGFNTGFRNDWLENLGLEVPSNLAELEEVVRAFAEDDPDGNGVDDTYAFTGGSNYGIFSLSAIFGTSPSLGYFTAEDGKSMYTNVTTDEFRQYWATLAKWYQAGWIDPEFLTDDRAACRNKFANGTIGIYSDNPWWWELARADIGPLQMLCATQNLEFTDALSFVTRWESEADGELAYNAFPASITGQASVYFGYETSDDIVIRMMKIIDEAVQLGTFDEEDKAAVREYATRSSGIEGKHWDIDENGRNNVHTPMTTEEQNELGAYLFPVAAYGDLGVFEGKPDEFVINLYNEGHTPNPIWNGRDKNLPSLASISTELVDMQTNVNDYYSTCYTQFISGDLDIHDDAVWAEYLATLEEYGVNDIVAAYEEYFGM